MRTVGFAHLRLRLVCAFRGHAWERRGALQHARPGFRPQAAYGCVRCGAIGVWVKPKKGGRA